MSEAAIFVFGSNLAGRHGRGAAREALDKHGAVYGQGVGRQGQSYGIPTKGMRLEVLPLETIRRHVEDFLHYARGNPQLVFRVTAIGTGLAGYSHADIGPMFADAPANCRLPAAWWAYRGEG